MSDRLRGEVIGFRQWAVSDELRLRAANSSFGDWNPGENVARCIPILEQRTACKHAPGHDHECGLYALHAPTFWYGKDARRETDQMLAWFARMTALTNGTRHVAGLVSAWGTIEVHHAGFRAERARVAAIAIPSGEDRRLDAAIARAVAAEYGVPCVPQDELEKVAAEFGSLVPTSLRPERQKREIEELVWIPPQDRLGWRTQRQHQQHWSHWQSQVPAPVERARELKRRTAYDPAAFVPRRKGGRR